MTTIVEFLRARLDEDEAVALHVDPSQSYRAMGAGLTHLDDHHATEHFRRQGPERVLREVEAKRRIVKWAEYAQNTTGDDVWDSENDHAAAIYVGASILRAVAAVYADHPDYRREWKP